MAFHVGSPLHSCNALRRWHCAWPEFAVELAYQLTVADRASWSLEAMDMGRIFTLLVALLSLGWATPVLAEVQLSFHSFNGSVLFGRYPHTFVVLEGTLEESGQPVNENFGFTAKKVSTAILDGPVEHDIMVEKPKYITKTNRHFTITITDVQYHQIMAEMREWRDAPGKYYDLSTRNCIHFVGEIARQIGLKVDYPKKMLRRPKKWLNHITAMNPQLGAKRIR